MLEEEWRSIDGYDGAYQVSNLGGVRRVAGLPKGLASRSLSPAPNITSGYLQVSLSGGGKRGPVRVHVLVAAAFLGPRPEGADVRHLDGDRSNARADNLAYGTRAENIADTIRHGRHPSQRSREPLTHCRAGHELTPANTYTTPQGAEHCRVCKNIQSRDSYRIRNGVTPDRYRNRRRKYTD